MELFPALLIGYLVGSLPVGYLMTQVARGVDLRRVGSGNVGATNVYRAGGRGMAVAVMVVDVAKGAIAVLVAGNGDHAVVAGAAAVVGHVYPVWLGFRGGKGVATAAGVFGVLSPWPTAIAAVVFGAMVARTRLVSLGSMAAMLVLPISEWLTPGAREIDLAATLVAGLILFRHRGNAARLWNGTERALGT